MVRNCLPPFQLLLDYFAQQFGILAVQFFLFGLIFHLTALMLTVFFKSLYNTIYYCFLKTEKSMSKLNQRGFSDLPLFFFHYNTPMINELIEEIIGHAPEKVDGNRTQEVDIYLKFIRRFDLPALELTPEKAKRQASLHRHWVKSREGYQMIKIGEHAVDQPFKLTCKCCGEEFESGRSNTLFCSPNCCAKFYRQEMAASRTRKCVCGNCGKKFTTTRNGVKYCCEACQRKIHRKMRYRQKRAEEQETETVCINTG